MNKLKKELKEFRKFKENYKFKQKEIKEIDECLFCDGLLLKDKDRK